jgi:hypothetical protein
MPYTKEEFVRETLEEILETLPVKKRLAGLSAKQRLEGLSLLLGLTRPGRIGTIRSTTTADRTRRGVLAVGKVPTPGRA